jgi:hypothetical protein
LGRERDVTRDAQHGVHIDNTLQQHRDRSARRRAAQTNKQGNAMHWPAMVLVHSHASSLHPDAA